MSRHWDEFSKSLAEPVPRRESLRRLGFVLAGAVFSPFGLDTAFAGRHDPCKSFCRCRNKSQQNACLATCRGCNNDGTRLCGSCAGGYVCADFDSDPANCGACFNYCGEAGPFEYGACVDGGCVYDCVEGAVRCFGTCTVLERDPFNCGACGQVCEDPGPYEYGWCENGRCESQCYDGTVLCNGTCTATYSDRFNCGACGNVCPAAAPFCSNGVCLDQYCGGANLNWDNSNCGWCGNVCPLQFACVYGVCEGSGGGDGGY